MAFVALASLFCWVFAGEEAFGANGPAPTVILLRVAPSDEVTTEATARVKGELVAAGFEVAVVPFSGDDALHDLESAGRERNAVAAFAIFARPFEAGTSVAEIWVSDRIRQKVVIQNAVLHETDRGRGSEILAVRAVEILKANLADLWAPPSPPSPDVPPPAPEPVPTPAPAPVPAFASGLGAGLGVGVVEGFGRSRASWSPELMVSYGWAHGLSVRATLAGLGPSTTFSATGGSASAARQFGVLEVVKTWWPRAAVVPFASAGCGAEHVRVAGVGEPPYQGHTSSDWSLTTTVGAGLGIRLVSTLSIIVQARGFAAWPSTVIQIDDVDVGRVGGPSLLADAGLFGTVP